MSIKNNNTMATKKKETYAQALARLEDIVSRIDNNEQVKHYMGVNLRGEFSLADTKA